eukprot:Seg764.6 transcript_id=Seg764.6/GoldUCD/mRNA.D3Y31 product="hypothetical protein" pseudo=true protein_id=Seg764.6/GoldUCD/D3Y31
MITATTTTDANLSTATMVLEKTKLSIAEKSALHSSRSTFDALLAVCLDWLSAIRKRKARCERSGKESAPEPHQAK